jgi:FkbM family methyltransferase
MSMNTKPFYNMLEAITFGQGLPRKVNGVQVKLPAKYIRYFPTNYEQDNFDFLYANCKEGHTVLDIGAHIGLFSTIAAKKVGVHGKVYAFEPAPATVPVLKQTIRINQLQQHIFPVQQAMGAGAGHITFYVSNTEADNSNSLVAYKEDRQLNGVQVVVNTIDNFVQENKLQQVNFLKIDVEGAEYDTLKGGVETFKHFRPHFILAIHPEPIQKKGDSLADIFDLLLSLQYQLTCEGKAITKTFFCNNRQLIDLHASPIEA